MQEIERSSMGEKVAWEVNEVSGRRRQVQQVEGSDASQPALGQGGQWKGIGKQEKKGSAPGSPGGWIEANDGRICECKHAKQVR